MARNMQIRDVPDDIADAIAARARAKGQSAQAYMLDLLAADVRRSRNIDLIAQFEGRDDGMHSTPGQAAELVRQARTEREEHLTETTGGCPCS
jgi:plasmid stability protein